MASNSRCGVIVAWAFASSACAGLYHVPLAQCPVQSASPAADKVVVRYLGVGGFLLSRGQDVLLTAPFFSNPSVVEVVLDQQITSDSDAIDAWLPPEASRAKAILVGHSHYYRLMDLPYIALNKVPGADIYGSRTTAHLLAPIVPALARKTPPTRVIALDETAAFDRTPGQWQSVGPNVRFLAIRSRHAPVAALTVRPPFQPGLLVPVSLWQGQSLVDRTTLPETASEWRAGTVFSFLIDFLDAAGGVVFRVLYVDSGAPAPYGFPPPAVLQERGVDLAILSAWGALAAVKGYPEDLVRATNPRHVILAQWENLFLGQDLAETMGAHAALPPVAKFGLARTDDLVKRIKKVRPARAPLPSVPCPSRSIFEFGVGNGFTPATETSR